MRDILECKFCNWQTKRWITTKTGKKCNQSNSLINHVIIEHEEEYQKIIAVIAVQKEAAKKAIEGEGE